MTKVDKCRKFGANIIQHGAHIGEAREFAMAEHKDLKYINGYNDVEIVAGAGSMGIEILEQVPDADVIVVPVGGAGLIAGVSLAIKTLRPSVQIVGVEPDNCASYAAALAAGHPVNGFKEATLADGLAVPVVGDISFEVARHCVDSVCSVSELNIAIAVLRLIEMEKLVVEGGGATGLAAILPGGPLHGKFKGKNVVVPLCGGNIDTTVLGRVIDRGLAADKRLIRFGATVIFHDGS
jgi:threonine dehydratase